MWNQQHDPSGLEGTKRSRKGLFVAGGCAVAAVLAATAFFGYQGYRHNQLVNTYTPVITDALVAQFDGKDAIDGLAARIMRSDGCQPRVTLSKEGKPEGTPLSPVEFCCFSISARA